MTKGEKIFMEGNGIMMAVLRTLGNCGSAHFSEISKVFASIAVSTKQDLHLMRFNLASILVLSSLPNFLSVGGLEFDYNPIQV